MPPWPLPRQRFWCGIGTSRLVGDTYLSDRYFVALARVVVGVHYLTDVVAGAVIGSLISWLTTGMIVRILLAQISI